MSDTIRVYAPIGTTVTLSTGAVITSTGSEVTPTSEIRRLITQHLLLTVDPIEEDPDPSPLPPGDDGVSSVPVSSLTSLVSDIPGRVAASYGGAAVLDGQEGIWLRDPASTSTADVGTILGTGTGRWKRVRERPNWFNVMWYGAKNDGLTHAMSSSYPSWAAISAAFPHIAKLSGETDAAAYTRVGAWDVNDAVIGAVIAATAPGNAEVFFPTGTYRITQTIVISHLKGVDNVSIVGSDIWGTFYPRTSLLWDGAYAVTAPMVCIAASDCSIERLAIRVKPGKRAFCGVEIGWDTSTPRFVHGAVVSRCFFWADAADTGIWVDGEMDYGVGLARCPPTGVVAASMGNLEDARISDCLFRGMTRCMIDIQGGQPYDTVIEKCRFWQYRGAVTAQPAGPNFKGLEPFGTGIRNASQSTGLLIIGCEFQSQARLLWLEQPTTVVMIGCDTENIKRLLHAPNLSAVTGPPVQIIGGRHQCKIEIDSSSRDPEGVIVAHDSYVHFYMGSPLIMQGMYIHSDYTADHFRLGIGSETKIELVGCTFPEDNCVWRSGPLIDHVGTTHIRGCVYASINTSTGITWRPMKDRTGVNIPNHYVDIVDANTSAAVSMINTISNGDVSDEKDANYRVYLTPSSYSGSPTMSLAYVSAQTATGFTVNLASAPGVGKTVRVYYHLER